MTAQVSQWGVGCGKQVPVGMQAHAHVHARARVRARACVRDWCMCVCARTRARARTCARTRTRRACATRATRGPLARKGPSGPDRALVHFCEITPAPVFPRPFSQELLRGGLGMKNADFARETSHMHDSDSAREVSRRRAKLVQQQQAL